LLDPIENKDRRVVTPIVWFPHDAIPAVIGGGSGTFAELPQLLKPSSFGQRRI
jgi:hypothetical protein